MVLILLVYQLVSVILALIVKRLLGYQLVLKCISVNLELSIGLSNSFKIYMP